MKGVHWLLIVAVAWWLRLGGAPPGPGMCEHLCGNVYVPFPFGLDTNCARSPDFLLNCTNIEGSGIRLHWGNLTIHKISVGDSTMIASLPEAYECYDQNGTLANKSSPLAIDLSPNPRYRFSETQNKLTVVGCNALAVVANREGTFGSGCVSFCSGNVDFAKNKTTCSGQGCCQASIPEGLKTLNISIFSIAQNASDSQLGRCARAFVVANRSFNISSLTLPRFQDVGNNSGLVLDWMVESDVICKKARSNPSSYACGNNADCIDFGNESGYRCVCKPGYNGNPYSPFEGCKDINECKEPKRYPCHGKCKNIPGSYECQCRLGKRGNGKERCKISPLSIVVPVMIASIVGITITASVKFTIRCRLRKINFRQKGDTMNSHIRIFTESKLAIATNNYADRNKLHNDGFSSVHKGTLKKHNGTKIVVKKLKDVDESRLNNDFQCELKILMNINCKYVVKLEGICLETRIPLLVYEYIPNRTLFQLIHQNESTISWEECFKIAAQAAYALNYMHSSTPPIFHGNIKSANILLDENNSVKISDLGTSVLISPKHRHIIATQKGDSLSYIDPESLVTDMLTSQSDVYSFGVVLVELLIGKKLHATESREPINTIDFISFVKGDRLPDVIDFEGASENEKVNVQNVAKIAVECLNQSSANRPPMHYVAQQLSSINPSSSMEEENEEADEDNHSTHDELRQNRSCCLPCMEMTSAPSYARVDPLSP